MWHNRIPVGSIHQCLEMCPSVNWNRLSTSEYVRGYKPKSRALHKSLGSKQQSVAIHFQSLTPYQLRSDSSLSSSPFYSIILERVGRCELPQRAFNPSLPPSERETERTISLSFSFFFLSVCCVQCKSPLPPPLSPPSLNLYMSHGHEWGLDSGTTATYTTHDQILFRLIVVDQMTKEENLNAMWL